MALHEEFFALSRAVGRQVFDDPVAFRAAFDDFVAEGSATTGEVSLLVGAIATGALQRLEDQVALGADPEAAIASQGDALARDRGTTETSGARWALSALAHAIGVVPADLVLTRPAAAAVEETAPRPPAPEVGATRPIAPPAASPAPSPAPPPPPEPPTPAPATPRRGVSPVLAAVVVVLVVIAATAVTVLLLREDDSPRSTAGATGTSGTADGSEEVLGQVDVTDGGKTVRVQLVHDGTDASVVLLADHDGSYTEVSRVPAGCPYLDTSYSAGIDTQSGNQLYWGWQNNGTEGFGAYGEVQVADEMLISFADPGAPAVCPGD